MTFTGRRLVAAIREAAATSPAAPSFRRRVFELLGERVPFEAGCLATTEPLSMLPTSLTTVGYQGAGVYGVVLDIEYGQPPEPTRFETMSRRPVPVRTLTQATGGRPRTSRYHADVLVPNGLEHEVRMIFRGRDGRSWGACTIARAGRDFTAEETGVLGEVLADVAEALRGTLFRDWATRVRARVEGPAFAVVNARNELESCSPAALDYLQRLGWGPAENPVAALPAAVVATGLRGSGRLATTCRVRTVDGEWLLIRGGLVPGVGAGATVLTFEPAPLSELAPLAADAYGLTRREREVMAHLLAGRTREEIARALVLSPYTVQDHLKSIYARTGTTGRRGLVALLVGSECVPRLGSPLGPDGWFDRPRAGAGV